MDIDAARYNRTREHQDPKKRHGDVQGAHLTDKVHQACCEAVVIIILITVIVVVPIFIVVFVVLILVIVVFVVLVFVVLILVIAVFVVPILVVVVFVIVVFVVLILVVAVFVVPILVVVVFVIVVFAVLILVVIVFVIPVLIILFISDRARLYTCTFPCFRGMSTLICLNHIVIQTQKFQRVLCHTVKVLIIEPVILKQLLKPNLSAVMFRILSPVFLILHDNSYLYFVLIRCASLCKP